MLEFTADALEQHYTRARYPGVRLKDYCEEDAERCLRYARRIFSFAAKVIKTWKKRYKAEI